MCDNLMLYKINNTGMTLEDIDIEDINEKTIMDLENDSQSTSFSKVLKAAKCLLDIMKTEDIKAVWTKDYLNESSHYTYEEFLDQAITYLTNKKIIKEEYAVECPHCQLLLKTYNKIDDVPKTLFCYNCTKEILSGNDNIIKVYSLL